MKAIGVPSNRLPNFLDKGLRAILNFSASLFRQLMASSSATLTCAMWLVFSTLLSVGAQAQSTPFEKAFQDGVVAMRAGDFDSADRDFSQAAKLNPSFAEAYLNLGIVRVQQARYDDAITSLKRGLALKPGLRGANFLLGISLYREDQYPGAVSALKRATKLEPANADVLMWLGIAEMANGDALSASYVLDKAAQLKPNDVDILYHRGRAHMLVSKETYEEMYKLAPDSWRVHQVLSQSFAEADRLDDAIAEAQLAIKMKPNESGLHQALGDLYWQQNQLAKAEEEFQNELKIDPDSTQSMYKLGVVSIERSKAEVAANLLAEVLKRTPHAADAEYQLGRANSQMGNVAEAVNNFKAAVADSSKSDSETVRQSYYQLAQLYRREQRPNESREALATFMHLKQQADAEQAEHLQDKLRRSAQLQDTAR
jgi:tetratricopeptide (TPR) repeat protein